MCVIWGVPYLLIRIAVREVEPATLVFFRTAPAGLVFLPLVLARGQLGALRGRWRWVLLYTAAELAVPWLLLSSAEQRLTSSFTALLVATVPLLGVLLARLAGSDAALLPDRRQLAGLALGLAGVAVLVGIDVRGASLTSVGEVLIVACGYASGPFIISRRLSDVPGLAVIAASLVITGLLYAPWALTHLPTHMGSEEALSVAGLAVLCTAVAFIVFFALIAEVGPGRATVITYFNPAVALLLGLAVLGEPFTIGLGLGFPLVLVGSVIGTARPRSGGPRSQPLAQSPAP